MRLKALIACFGILWSCSLSHAFDHGSLYGDFVAVDAQDGKIDGSADLLTTALCGKCHNDKISEVMATVHYTFRSENKMIDFPGGGMHGHYDRSSGLTGGNTVVNYYFDSERGCGKCHVGKYLPGTMGEIDLLTGLPTANMEKVRNGIDCLICHAATYSGRDKLVEEIDADGKKTKYWHQDRTWSAVSSIGRSTTAACLRCHSEAASPNERGTPFATWNDVHIASAAFSGNACTRCHNVGKHKMVRGNHIAEIFASDYQVGSAENELKCEKCHSAKPHDKETLNGHVSRVACQTCHIPWTSGATYSRWELDGTQTEFARGGIFSAEDSKPYTTAGMSEREVWETYKMRPRYLWFNGKASYLAQPIGSKGENGSKIWPFKPLSSGLPVDTSGLRMADLLDDATLQTAMVRTGSMVPGDAPGATALAGVGTLANRTVDSSLNLELQREMLEVPLLLNLDLEVLKSGGSMTPAIDSAMSKTYNSLNFLGKLFGAPADAAVLSIFNGNYRSDSYLVTTLPTGQNMQKYNANYPSGSFLTLTHGVRPSSEALKCYDCHSSRGVMAGNRLRVYDRLDGNMNPVYREVDNFDVLGIKPQGGI